jgi:hypothetical protein
VLNRVRVAIVDELFGQPLDDARALLRLAQQQPSAVGADLAPIEIARTRRS